LIPDIKTLIMIKDRQIQALYNEWKKLAGEMCI
jgi:hypothetical protein